MNKKTILLEDLGLYGWDYYEPILFASLVSELPLLLIGKHGSAKSFILERLADLLNLKFGNYNASLLNYDDLVGIPIPTSDNSSLTYISNSSSIWDKEVIFIDEINRTKIELQNKLFPLIYDKRIQGINLDKLKYRWSAMNPPCNDEEEELNYLGAYPLDYALADRFPYIIEVPCFNDLNDDDKRNILLDNFNGKHNINIDINKIILDIKNEVNNIKNDDLEKYTNYVLALANLLNNYLGYISTRRMSMMLESLMYVHASRIVINKYLDNNEVTNFNDSCYLHIHCCISDIANKHIDKLVLINLVDNALELCMSNESYETKILLIKDDFDRLKKIIKNKDKLSDEFLNKILLSSLSKLDIYKKRIMSLICYLVFRKNPNLNATLIETLSMEIKPIMDVKKISNLVSLNDKRLSNKIISVLHSYSTTSSYYKYLNNLLYSFFPNDYKSEDDVNSLAKLFVETYEDLIDE